MPKTSVANKDPRFENRRRLSRHEVVLKSRGFHLGLLLVLQHWSLTLTVFSSALSPLSSIWL
jgi:hypothetical protein